MKFERDEDIEPLLRVIGGYLTLMLNSNKTRLLIEVHPDRRTLATIEIGDEHVGR